MKERRRDTDKNTRDQTGKKEKRRAVRKPKETAENTLERKKERCSRGEHLRDPPEAEPEEIVRATTGKGKRKRNFVSAAR